MKKFLSILLICTLAIGEVVISPNMNLPVPVVGTTPGPDWANNINSCMGGIDEHDHTPGHGVAISSSSIDINSDFSIDGFSLTDVEAIVFDAIPSFSTSQSVYVVSPDLFFRDGNGNQIRITQSGAVSGASGTITGLPSGTASASFQSVGGTFQFQSATNTPANGSFASVLLAEQTTSPNTITLKSPTSLAASYNVTWPAAVPSATSLLAMSTSGVLSTVPYKTPTVQKFSSSSGTYTLPTGPSPIYLKIMMVGGGGGGGGSTSGSGSDGNDTTFSTITAGKGFGGGAASGANGVGGTGSLGAGPIGYIINGTYGSCPVNTTGTVATGPGGVGGSSAYFSGGGAGGVSGGAGTNGIPNTGGGGGGGGGGASSEGGCGGGAGAYAEAMITSALASTYSYSVGAGGAGGTGGNDGGTGATGYIAIWEYYQ